MEDLRDAVFIQVRVHFGALGLLSVFELLLVVILRCIVVMMRVSVKLMQQA